MLPILLIFSLLLNLLQFLKSHDLEDEKPTYKVANVVDGDTIVIEGNQRIRLSNIYAPELEYCGGQEAKDYLEKLVLGKKVSIESQNEDVFNRSLALVYVAGTLVNEEMLAQGLVRYDGSPNSKREILKAAYDSAVESKKGIHGPPCRAEKPDKPNCLIKGNIQRSDSTTKNYFFPGCSEYNATIVEKDLGEAWFCTEKQAKDAGFAKGTHCPEKYEAP
jgi:endonuclease YncB( thermonuclease family)